MENILEIIRTDTFLLALVGIIFIIFMLYIVNCIKLSRIRKEYKKFMEKIGNGTNIEEILEKHIDRINKTIAKNDELEKFCV